MTAIAECYEKLIFILLQDCKLDKNDKKGLFVLDKDYSWKINKRKMREVYNDI